MLLQKLVFSTLWQAILVAGMLSTQSKGIQAVGRCFRARQRQLTSEILILHEKIFMGTCTGVGQLPDQDAYVIFFRLFQP